MDLTPDELRRLAPIGELHADTIADALIDALTAAYRAGREDAGRAVERFGEPLACFECGPDVGGFAAAARGDQPRTPSGCDGEDSPEERQQ